MIGLLIGNLAVLLGSHALLRRVRTGETSSDAVLFLLLRLTLISAMVLVAAAAGLLSPSWLTVASIVALAALLWNGEHRHLPRFRLPDVGKGVLVFAVVLVARSLIQVWIFAPFQRDALTYHLPKIGEWIQHEGFTREWGLDLRSTFPSGFELIETWWVAFLHHDVLIEMAGLEFLLLGFLSVVDLCRRMGIAPRFAFLGGLLYALTPGICLQATSCLNDAPAAALWTATAALILGRAPWSLLVLPVALGFGVKPTYGYAIPGLALLAFWWRPRSATRWTLGIAALALAVGSTWYVRNAVVYGNPLYPMGPKGISVQEGHVAQRFGPSVHGLVENLSRVAETRIDDHLGPYDPELPYISGWGPATFAVGLIAVFLAIRTDPSMRRLAAAFGVSLLSVLLLVVFDPWFLRYVLFFPALFAIASAKLAGDLPEASMIVWAALLFEFAGTCIPGRFPFGAVTELAAQPWRQRTLYPQPQLRDIAVLGFLEHPGDEVKIYPLYGPDFSRRIVLLRAASPDQLLDVLRREGLKYLYCPKDHELLQDCLARNRISRLGGGLFAVK
ncbi:MAG TPA: hypothetical protein VMU54_20670 [Planctomycetota bacterium]|nr:hypothetical protein [Planctomycetota bacterium]